MPGRGRRYVMERRKAAVIGCGALGGLIASGIVEDLSASWMLCGVLARSVQSAERLAAGLGVRAFAKADELLEARPDVVVEAAGIEAVRRYAEDVLLCGASFIVLSAGALADEALALRLRRAAEQGGGALYVVSGAVGGFDLLQALSFRQRQLQRAGRRPLPGQEFHVRVDNVKAPGSLNGAPYLEGRPLPEDARKEIFRGSAAQAIEGFPKNVNVAVAAALASSGLDGAMVSIVSDPGLSENTHRIVAEGFGVRADMTFSSLPDAENPRSSTLSAWSVLALLENLASPVRFF